MCNRLKLGRPLDDAYTYGGDRLLQELALAGCAHAGLDRRCHHLDTTSVSRRGTSGPDSDEPALTMTHGSSKDHRPDLKPAMLELLVSQDGGVPVVRQRGRARPRTSRCSKHERRHGGTPSRPRPAPRSLVAEAHLDHEDKASRLQSIGFITRLPIPAHVRADDATRAHDTPVKACVVLRTPSDASAWRHAEVIAASNGQSQGEGGLRLLHEPLCCVSSWLVKKPHRLDGLLMVMTLALRVYSVAPRRLRKPCAKPPATMPNHLPPHVADLPWGLLVVGRHAPGPGDAARSGS
jgi:transposase